MRCAYALVSHPHRGDAALRAMLHTPPAPITAPDGTREGWTWRASEVAWLTLRSRRDLQGAPWVTVESRRLGL